MKIIVWGICVVVFCLPLYLVRFTIFGIPTTVLEMMIYVLFLIWLVQRWFRGMNGELNGFKGWILPIILILAGVTLATIFSSDLRTSAGIWKAWFVDPLLFFIVIISVIKNIKQIKTVLYSLFFSGVVVSIISLIYLLQGKLNASGRLQAFYDSPNYLAMFLAPALVIGFWYYLFTFLGRPSEAASRTSPSLSRLRREPCPLGLATRKKIIPETFLITFFVVCLLLSICFTKSYGAWLGIIAAVCFGLLIYLFKLKKIKLVWMVLFFALALVLILGYCKLTTVGGEVSLNARVEIWQKAWQVFKTNPILGIGPGTFGDYFPPYPEWGVPQPHNLYLAFLLQTGILGFIGFLWLIVWFYKNGINLPAGKAGNLNIILISIMSYILIHGLVDTTYWKNDLSIIFWLMIGLMVKLSIGRFFGRIRL